MTAPAAATRSALRVEILGSGGYHPSERRHTACVYLPELGLVLDAGTGAFRLHGLAASDKLSTDRLDIVLTHGHLDHVVGLTFLIGLQREGRPIETVVHAAPATLDAVRDHLLAPALFPIAPVTGFAPLGDSLALPSGVRLTAFELDHPGGSVGLRLDVGDRSIAYVTDTRPISAETVKAIQGVDLLLHEAYFEASRRQLADDSGHCTAPDAAEAAVACGAKRLVLMHINPRATEADEARALAEAQAIRPDAEYGRDGMVIEV